MSALWRSLLPALILACSPAIAGELTVRLQDQKGRAAGGGVVVAAPQFPVAAEPPGRKAVMDQVNEEFVPYVLPVQVGTNVSFPNQDDIRHHVYSFSEAKKFELPLYKGTPAEPVLFDQPGEVVLGCNIHDHMRGYIYVASSPYFAVAGEDGVARLEDLPPGPYRVTVWHPLLRKDAEPRTVDLAAAQAPPEVAFELQLKPALRLRGSKAGGKKY